MSHRLEQAFRDTEVHVWVDRTHLVATPADPGVAAGPPPPGGACHVITAWNPGGDLADPVENARAQRELRATVSEAGWTVHDAEGVALDDSWAEDSLALVGVDESEVLDLARRFGQAAIFRWTGEHLAIVWTDGRDDTVLGYRSEDVTRRAS